MASRSIWWSRSGASIRVPAKKKVSLTFSAVIGRNREEADAMVRIDHSESLARQAESLARQAKFLGRGAVLVQTRHRELARYLLYMDAVGPRCGVVGLRDRGIAGLPASSSVSPMILRGPGSNPRHAVCNQRLSKRRKLNYGTIAGCHPEAWDQGLFRHDGPAHVQGRTAGSRRRFHRPEIAKIRIEPCKEFDLAALDKATQEALKTLSQGRRMRWIRLALTAPTPRKASTDGFLATSAPMGRIT